MFMQIVPVLDLRDGIVVHARRGDRASYAPLRSSLFMGCDPPSALQALVRACNAPAVYIADLDAITCRSPQRALLLALREHSPVPIWLDAGFDDAEAALEAHAAGFIPVMGSESLRDSSPIAAMADRLPSDAWLLSLDADAQGPRDPAGVLQQTQHWPQRVIAMDLSRVGSEAGGVGDWLMRCRALAPSRDWIAAGGVRNRNDLDALAAVGVDTALVATALHAGSLDVQSPA
jgi:phosphoribosylformimino-5-aminoimidazole carboxamide ribotide isomerase